MYTITYHIVCMATTIHRWSDDQTITITEDPEDEYNNSGQRGQGSQQWLVNQLAYYKDIELSEDEYDKCLLYEERSNN